MGYAGVAQFFPGVVLGLFSKKVNGTGVFAGMFCGVAVVAFLILTNRDPWMGFNPGFIALCLNSAVVVAMTVLQPNRLPQSEDGFIVPVGPQTEVLR
jgi:SSS family solute:Na+ symporter